MGVHSVRFAAGEAPTAQATKYTVPALKRSIIKGFSVWNDAAAAGRVTLVLLDSSNAVMSYVDKYLTAKGGVGEADHVMVWQVLYAGEKLAVIASQALMYYTVSGAELDV